MKKVNGNGKATSPTRRALMTRVAGGFLSCWMSYFRYHTNPGRSLRAPALPRALALPWSCKPIAHHLGVDEGLFWSSDEDQWSLIWVLGLAKRNGHALAEYIFREVGDGLRSSLHGNRDPQEPRLAKPLDLQPFRIDDCFDPPVG